MNRNLGEPCSLLGESRLEIPGLRAGLLGLFVRFPTWPLGTRCARLFSRPDDELSAQGRLGA